MKKLMAIVLLFMMALSTVSVYADGQEDEVMPETIKISVRDPIMSVGSTQKLIVDVTPTNAFGYTLEYHSDNTDVITAAIGTLIANKEGTANITVKVSGTEVSDTIPIIVQGQGNSDSNPSAPSEDDIKVSSIEAEDETLYIERYSEEKIYYDILPKNATNKGVSFESMNTSIATVDKNGWVYGKRTGSTRIRIASRDGNAETFVKVYVTDDETRDSSVRSISIMHEGKVVKDTFEMMEKETVSFEIKAYPSSADADVKWKSLDEDIAEVDENGRVTGIGVGTCKIQAVSRSNSAKKSTITVKVTRYVRKPDSIRIEPPQDADFSAGNTVALNPVFSPDDTTERTLRWYVDGAGTIDQNGRLTITGGGEIKVRAYTPDRKVSAEYVIHAVYGEKFFSPIGEAYNLKPDRRIEIYFDSEVDGNSAKANIFAGTDLNGNGEQIPLVIQPVKNKLVITAVHGWPAGESYLFIKENIQDTAGNKLGMNIKYKINVRGSSE